MSSTEEKKDLQQRTDIEVKRSVSDEVEGNLNVEKGNEESEISEERRGTVLEEGEIMEVWKDVTLEKASRSSKQKHQDLKYGQVQIATPSRFAALSDTKESEEENVQEEETIMEETDKKNEEDYIEEEGSEIEELERKNGREILPRQSKTKHKTRSVLLDPEPSTPSPKTMNRKALSKKCARTSPRPSIPKLTDRPLQEDQHVRPEALGPACHFSSVRRRKGDATKTREEARVLVFQNAVAPQIVKK
ncbi:hypothetical protein DY000_02015533 [Brassica cretica]|uniref:Shugoshin C-terminal domain-containing protein n=1 Tax=Brassica cretica TaxID=69181 RepID=A0ABQ7D3S1_BRACR|nr:hypothetical protein DY000_02015533 [Brassica cretica]